ncbi:MAG: hypothetical protein R3F43_19075 [bacterium]
MLQLAQHRLRRPAAGAGRGGGPGARGARGGPGARGGRARGRGGRGLLAPLALDATLLAVVGAPDGSVEVAAFGDGVVFGVRADGTLEAWPIDQGACRPTRPMAWMPAASRTCAGPAV